MEFTLEIILLLICLGFLIGTISAIAGIGGGVFFVVMLTLVFGLPINVAIDTSNFIILISSSAAFITYLREGRIPFKITLIFAFFSMLGVFSCMLLFLFIEIDNSLLRIIFAITLLLAGLNMINKAITTRKGLKNLNIQEEDFSLDSYDFKADLHKSLPLFFLAGFLSYLLGLGGGIINVPTLRIALGFPIHNATAISTGIIFFSAIFTVSLKSIVGHIDYITGTFVAIGAVMGAIIGAKVSKKIPKMHLQFIVAGILMFLAIRMLLV